MTPARHPLPETLISFASGTLPGAISAVVACHLTMCRLCADDVRRLEVLGGLMLDRVEAERAGKDSVGEAMARSPGPRRRAERNAVIAPDHPLLAPLLTHDFPFHEDIPWQRVGPGAQQYQIAFPESLEQIRLLRLMPGETLPETLQKSGLALVLQGQFSDESGNEYRRGDILEWTEGTGPKVKVAGDGECVCLISRDDAADEVVKPFRRLADRHEALRRLGLSKEWQTPAALAASLALLVGIGLGWLARGGHETGSVNELVRFEGHRVLAQGALQDVLEGLPSGEEKAATLHGQDFRLGIRMTFQDQAGGYCRQYRVAASPSEQYAGIACRKDDGWDIRIQALVPPASAGGQTVPADGGANAAMDAVVGAWMSGDPIVGQDEAAIMGKGWKR